MAKHEVKSFDVKRDRSRDKNKKDTQRNSQDRYQTR